MNDQWYVPPITIEKRGTRGSVVISETVNGLLEQHAVRIEKAIYKAMSEYQLKTVIEEAAKELKLRKH